MARRSLAAKLGYKLLWSLLNDLEITNISTFWFAKSRMVLMNAFAEVVKLVDTHVSGACGASYAGSSPAFGT